MNCEEVTKLIGEFHDDLLDSPLKENLKDHLAVCSSCNAVLGQFQNLSKLLQKSSISLPAESRFSELMEAFKTQHNQPVKTEPYWWRLVFIGSVSIPKPALTAALVFIAVAITAANIIGRKTAIHYADATNSSIPAPLSSPAEIAAQTKIVEVPVTKVVEVPVIKEKIVNRVVYVNGRSNSAAQNKTRRNNSGQSGSILNNSLADNKYFTRTSLKGFQPLPAFKTKIIGEEKPNEK